MVTEDLDITADPRIVHPTGAIARISHPVISLYNVQVHKLALLFQFLQYFLQTVKIQILKLLKHCSINQKNICKTTLEDSSKNVYDGFFIISNSGNHLKSDSLKCGNLISVDLHYMKSLTYTERRQEPVAGLLMMTDDFYLRCLAFHTPR